MPDIPARTSDHADIASVEIGSQARDSVIDLALPFLTSTEVLQPKIPANKQNQADLKRLGSLSQGLASSEVSPSGLFLALGTRFGM